jgi:hypothetical protein
LSSKRSKALLSNSAVPKVEIPTSQNRTSKKYALPKGIAAPEAGTEAGSGAGTENRKPEPKTENRKPEPKTENRKPEAANRKPKTAPNRALTDPEPDIIEDDEPAAAPPIPEPDAPPPARKKRASTVSRFRARTQSWFSDGDDLENQDEVAGEDEYHEEPPAWLSLVRDKPLFVAAAAVVLILVIVLLLT